MDNVNSGEAALDRRSSARASSGAWPQDGDGFSIGSATEPADSGAFVFAAGAEPNGNRMRSSIASGDESARSNAIVSLCAAGCSNASNPDIPGIASCMLAASRNLA